MKIGLLSLGCARNLVDSEVILGYLRQAGFTVCEEIEQAELAIVNTCAFIREAQEESIEVILKLGQLKQANKIRKIIVCGCLPERYKDELPKELKEVDAFVGVGSIDKIAEVARSVWDNGEVRTEFGRPQFLYTHSSRRSLLTPGHFVYVKISEGCNHRCSFCVIPRLRGRYRSRPMVSILKEAQAFFGRRGVSEINLIGQDTTMYGRDLYKRSRIVQLLAGLAKQADGKWIRLLYAHPANFPPELIDVIRDSQNICKYIDLPVQHINDRILKEMRRGTSRKQLFKLIDTLRKEIPGLAIRTTLIVGFPGETDAEFGELLEFIRQVKFERLGIFKYSQEGGTPAYQFARQVPEKVKQRRYEAAISLQQDISAKINAGFLGKKLRLLIDEPDPRDKNLYLGRMQFDAPEVDGCVYVKSQKKLKPGDFVQAKIIDTLEYDLVGEVSNNSINYKP